MVEPTRNLRQTINEAAEDIHRSVNHPRWDSFRRAQPRAAAKSGYPLEENLPIFLAGSEEETHAAELQDNWAYDDRTQDAWQSETDLHHNPLQQRALQQSDWQHSGYQQDPWEQGHWEAQRRKGQTARRIVKFGLVAVVLAGAVFAAYTLQVKRALIADASASLAAVLPAIPGVRNTAPAPQRAVQAVAEPAQARPSPASAPSRQAIANAFQTALQTQPTVQPSQPVIQPPAILPPPEPAARSIDPDELAALLKRAQSMMDVGDIASARLLLERAAGAREAKAALLLAQTYDPAVIGATDLRSIAADPETARLWYQKAAEFGSQEARNRLAQMTN